jgi:hypothetical protein
MFVVETMYEPLKAITNNGAKKKKSNCGHGHGPNTMKDFIESYKRKSRLADGIQDNNSDRSEKKQQQRVKK